MPTNISAGLSAGLLSVYVSIWHGESAIEWWCDVFEGQDVVRAGGRCYCDSYNNEIDARIVE